MLGNRQPRIHDVMELEALVRQMGFLPFFFCAIPNFSLEEFTSSRYWFVDGVDGPWEWRIEVARRGVVAYGKLFDKKAGLVSWEWYPDLANYRRNGYDFNAHYEDGLASHRESSGEARDGCSFSGRPHTLKGPETSGWVWSQRLKRL